VKQISDAGECTVLQVELIRPVVVCIEHVTQVYVVEAVIQLVEATKHLVVRIYQGANGFSVLDDVKDTLLCQRRS